MNKIKFYINIIDAIVCFIRIYLYFCIINEDDMNEVKKRLPLQCPSCDAPLKVGRLRQFERYGEEYRSQLPYSSKYVGRYNR